MGEVKYFKIRGLRYAFVAGYRYALVPGTAETERSRGLRFGCGLSLRSCSWHRGDRARARRMEGSRGLRSYFPENEWNLKLKNHSDSRCY